MQKIKQVKIKNIGPIQGLMVIDFDENALLTSLSGHNGIGKSTALKCISTLQTGLLYTAKEDIVNNKCTSGYMEATFLGPSGELFTHHVGLGKGESVWLQTPKEKVTGSTLIQKYLAAYHAVNPRTLLKTNFVRQGELAAIMSDMKTDRVKVISELAGIENAEAVWTSLGKEVGKYRIDESAPVELQRTTDLLATAKQKLTESAKDLEDAPVIPDDAETPLHKTINDWQRGAEAQRDLSVLHFDSTQINPLREQLSSVAASGRHRAKSASEINSADLSKIVDSYKRCELLLEQKPKQLELKAKLDEYLAANIPRPENHLPDVLPLRELLSTARHAYKDAHKHLVDIGTGLCGSCGQALPNAEQAKEENTAKAESSKATIDKLEKQVTELENAHRSIVAAQEVYDRKHSAYEQRRSENEAYFASLEKLAAPSEDDYMRSVAHLAERERLLGEVAALKQQYAQLDGELKTMLAKQQAYEERFSSLTDIVTKAPSKQLMTDAREQLVAVASARRKYSELSATLTCARTEVKQREENYNRAKLSYDEFVKNRTVVKNLRHMRDLVHRDALPAKVSSQFLVKVAARANEYLKPFEADFGLEADLQEMSFLAVYPDETSIRIDQLSGGWTTTVALAIRCATSDLISKINKTLILDECITFLDKDNLARMPFVLEKIKAVNQQVGRQMIMVTHEAILSDVADHKIDLDDAIKA